MNHRLPNPLELSTRPPTKTEAQAIMRPMERFDRLLADTAKAWNIPAAKWTRIAATMNRRPGRRETIPKIGAVYARKAPTFSGLDFMRGRVSLDLIDYRMGQRPALSTTKFRLATSIQYTPRLSLRVRLVALAASGPEQTSSPVAQACLNRGQMIQWRML